MCSRIAQVKLTPLRYAPRCALASLRYAHPHITAIKRKNPRLGFFPNFFRFAPETSLNRDVIRNRKKDLKNQKGVGGISINLINSDSINNQYGEI